MSSKSKKGRKKSGSQFYPTLEKISKTSGSFPVKVHDAKKVLKYQQVFDMEMQFTDDGRKGIANFGIEVDHMNIVVVWRGRYAEIDSSMITQAAISGIDRVMKQQGDNREPKGKIIKPKLIIP